MRVMEAELIELRMQSTRAAVLVGNTTSDAVHMSDQDPIAVPGQSTDGPESTDITVSLKRKNTKEEPNPEKRRRPDGASSTLLNKPTTVSAGFRP